MRWICGKYKIHTSFRLLIELPRYDFLLIHAQSIIIKKKLLPHKPAPSRLLAAFPFRTEALERMKKHTSIEEPI